MAADLGYRHLAAWMRDIELKWQLHCSKRADGTPRMTLAEQIDHMRKLSSQVGATGTKVVYAGSGTLLNAATVDEPAIIVEHSAYWASARDIEEDGVIAVCGWSYRV